MRRKNSSFLVCFDPFSLESTLGSLLSCFKRQEQEKREDQNLALRSFVCLAWSKLSSAADAVLQGFCDFGNQDRRRRSLWQIPWQLTAAAPNAAFSTSFIRLHGGLEA